METLIKQFIFVASSDCIGVELIAFISGSAMHANFVYDIEVLYIELR